MKRILTKMVNLSAILGCALLIGIGLDGGWRATRSLWPGLHEDGSKFSTIIINRASGLGNKFDVFTRQIRVANGNYDFNDHGQFYYPGVAALMSEGSYAALLRTLHYSNLFGFILALALFFQVARGLKSTLTVSLIYGTAGALAMAGILQYLLGRPDHGIVLVLLLFGLVDVFILKGRFSAVWRGVQIGVVGAISPFPGYLLGVFMVYAEALGGVRGRQLIRHAIVSMLVALVCWAGLTTLVYPGPLSALFVRIVGDGARHHEGLTHLYFNFPTINLARFNKSWVTLKFAPLLILPLLLAASIVLVRSFRGLRAPGSRLLRLIILGLLIVVPGQLWFFVVYWPEINYSLLGLYPAIARWSLAQFGPAAAGPGFSFQLVERHRRLEQSLTISAGAFRGALVLLCAATLLLPGLGYLRSSLLQRAVQRHGISYQTAYARYQELKATLRDDEYILISEYTSGNSRSAVVFDGPPWKARASFVEDDLNREFTRMKGRYYFVIQDSLIDTNLPASLGAYRLIEKRLTPEPVQIFGLRVASITPGYGYAVYVLDQAAEGGESTRDNSWE